MRSLVFFDYENKCIHSRAFAKSLGSYLSLSILNGAILLPSLSAPAIPLERKDGVEDFRARSLEKERDKQEFYSPIMSKVLRAVFLLYTLGNRPSFFVQLCSMVTVTCILGAARTQGTLPQYFSQSKPTR